MFFGDRKVENGIDSLFDFDKDGILNPKEQFFELDYLLENPDATIEDVSNDLNLPIKLIDQFYGDGILDSTSNLEEDIIKIYQGKKDFEKVQSMFELKSKENKVKVLEKTTND